MVNLLNDPAVVAGRRCGPVTVPNHKLVPDIRYLLDARVDEVLPRTRLPRGRPGDARRGAVRLRRPALPDPSGLRARSTSSTTTR